MDDNNNNDENTINEEENYNEIEDYNYNEDENVDTVEKGQEEILEEMFLKAQQDTESSKIDSYLDIINLDESKEKIWSYKCYTEICLIYLQIEDHYSFPIFYKKLMEMARTIDFKYLRPHVESSITVFLNEIFSHCSSSISHWLEDLTEGFNRFEQDKVINTFEAVINLKILVLEKGGKHFDNYKVLDQGKNNISLIDPRMLEFLRDREELEKLASEYFIKECKCDPKYLDKKGNTIFYYNPPYNKRGGEPYAVPVGWMGFGIEVENRYKESDWISADGGQGEWAVAYHGFGCRMGSEQIKNIIKTIIHDNLKPGSGQAFSAAVDRRHKGQSCGTGVYVTPKIEVAMGYAGTITLGKKNYQLVIMVRVNPSKIREPTTQPDYWIVDGKSDQLRPYRLLIKEFNGKIYRY
jgi:hypothetical protein